jgi:hypothetical protein
VIIAKLILALLGLAAVWLLWRAAYVGWRDRRPRMLLGGGGLLTLAVAGWLFALGKTAGAVVVLGAVAVTLLWTAVADVWRKGKARR